jgi:2-polyprenyl-3-methyl-5-hydroxy-6-metoxy-1,4-benzoquinol methylase
MPLRLLVVVASYGQKNVPFLRRLIQGYRSMPLDVDVVVVSEGPKDLGADVPVVVGLPSANPWSLPFAHKRIFAERVEQYDLFAYSEDDMEVTTANIAAFLRLAGQLRADEIAGFLRYEVDASGAWSLPDIHDRFHWNPDAVAQRGEHTIGEFTNVHAAFYLLTRAQLERALASGQFLGEPYEAEYDMLVTAATDPYTRCGFRKVLALSSVDDFLIHHLSDRYAGRMGVPLSTFREQIQAQLEIANGKRQPTRLCRTQSRLLQGEWSKNYYETPSEALLARVPTTARHILSIGCGWGATEATLMACGAVVTAVPVDSVIGAVVENRGVDVLYGTLADCWHQLDGRRFDAVVVSDLLHLLPDPGRVVEQCARRLRRGGALVLAGPNFGSLRVRAKQALGKRDYRKLSTFEASGIHTLGPARLTRYLRQAGLAVVDVCWPLETPTGRIDDRLGRYGAPTWIVCATR